MLVLSLQYIRRVTVPLVAVSTLQNGVALLICECPLIVTLRLQAAALPTVWTVWALPNLPNIQLHKTVSKL